MSKIIRASTTEELLDVLYELVCPMLSTDECVKCISRDGNVLFTSDVEQLLSHLDIEHPASELVIQALKSHKCQERTGTKTLLFMMTRLAKAITWLHDLGIPIYTSLRIVREAIIQLSKQVDELACAVGTSNETIPIHPTVMSNFTEAKAGYSPETMRNCTFSRDVKASEAEHNVLESLADLNQDKVKFSSTQTSENNESKLKGLPFSSAHYPSSSQASVLSVNNNIKEREMPYQKLCAKKITFEENPKSPDDLNKSLLEFHSNFDNTAEIKSNSISDNAIFALNLPCLQLESEKTVKTDMAQNGLVSHKENTNFTGPVVIHSCTDIGYRRYEVIEQNEHAVSNGQLCAEMRLPKTHEKFTVKSDPVYLKMLDMNDTKERTEDDIQWYFDSDISAHQNSGVSCFSAYSNTSDQTVPASQEFQDNQFAQNDLPTQEKFIPKDFKMTYKPVNDIQPTNTTDDICSQNNVAIDMNVPSFQDEVQHDSDFEDCFDNVVNREEIVVVEHIPSVDAVICNDKPSFMEKLFHKTWDSHSNNTSKVKLHNVKMHYFSDIDFDDVSDTTFRQKIFQGNDGDENDAFDACFSDEDKKCSLDTNHSESDVFSVDTVTLSYTCKLKNPSLQKCKQVSRLSRENYQDFVDLCETEEPTNSSKCVTCSESERVNESDNGVHKLTRTGSCDISPKLTEVKSEIEEINSMLNSLGAKKSVLKAPLISRHFQIKDSHTPKPFLAGSPECSSLCDFSFGSFQTNVNRTKDTNDLITNVERTKDTSDFVTIVDRTNNISDLTELFSEGDSFEIAAARSLKEGENINSHIHGCHGHTIGEIKNLDKDGYNGLNTSQTADDINGYGSSQFLDIMTGKKKLEHLQHLLLEKKAKFKSNLMQKVMISSHNFSKYEKLDLSAAEECSLAVSLPTHTQSSSAGNLTNNIAMETVHKDCCSTSLVSNIDKHTIDISNYEESQAMTCFGYEKSVASSITDRDIVTDEPVQLRQYLSSLPTQLQDPGAKSCTIYEEELTSVESIQKVCHEDLETVSSFPVTAEHLSCLHGCPDDMMTLARQIFQNQIAKYGDKRFNLSLVDCISVPVLSSSLSSCVTEAASISSVSLITGLVMKCDSGFLDKLDVTGAVYSKRTLLIGADLTPNFHHIGYKPTLSKRQFVSTGMKEQESGERAWSLRVFSVIMQLNVELLLVKGKVCSVFTDMCSGAGVLILSNIHYRTLSVLSQIHGVDIVTYAAEASEINISSLQIKCLTSNWMDQEWNKNGSQHYIVVTNTTDVQTVVLHNSCEMEASLKEEKFWKCLHGIANAHSDGKVLPGEGVTELWCAGKIQHKVEQCLASQSLMESVALEALGVVFMDYYSTVKSNTQHLLNRNSSVRKDVENFPQHSHFIKSNYFPLYLNSEHSYLPMESNDQHPAKPFLLKKVADQFQILNFSVCDNYLSKVSSWQTALDLVSILLNLGSLVTTGVDDTDNSDNIVLL